MTLEVGLPSFLERAAIWKLHLGRVHASEKDISSLGEFSSGLSGAAIRAAAFDIARDTLQRGSDTINLPHAMRRLARVLWYQRYELFTNPMDEMAALREWAPSIFSLRVLAELFEVSMRQAGNAAKGAQNARDRSDSTSPL